MNYTKAQKRAIQDVLCEITATYRRRIMKLKPKDMKGEKFYNRCQQIMFNVVCDVQGKYGCYAGRRESEARLKKKEKSA